MPRVVAGVAAAFDKTFQCEAGIADGFVGHDDEQHTAGLQEAHHPCDAGGKVFYEVDHVQCKTEVDTAIGRQFFPERSAAASISSNPTASAMPRRKCAFAFSKAL